MGPILFSSPADALERGPRRGGHGMRLGLEVYAFFFDETIRCLR